MKASTSLNCNRSGNTARSLTVWPIFPEASQNRIGTDSFSSVMRLSLARTKRQARKPAATYLTCAEFTRDKVGPCWGGFELSVAGMSLTSGYYGVKLTPAFSQALQPRFLNASGLINHFQAAAYFDEPCKPLVLLLVEGAIGLFAAVLVGLYFRDGRNWREDIPEYLVVVVLSAILGTWILCYMGHR